MIIGFAVLIVALSAWFLANRWNRPHIGDLLVQNTDKTTPAGPKINVTTWNIGFAALGAKADLFIDGGSSVRALSRDELTQAARVIGDKLVAKDADIVLLQENASACFMTRGVDVYGGLQRKLSAYASCFWSDFRTFLVPQPFNFRHGITTFTKLSVAECITLETPQDPLYYYGFLKKYYGGIVQKYPIKGHGAAWVVINIHLSAFDAAARKDQLAVLMDYAEQEYRFGNHVVIGGDWNMRLLPVEFLHNPPKDDLFDVFDFPHDTLPNGWVLAADDCTATLRSMNAAFVEGQTYTSIVDGFMVSPNVRIEALKTDDLGFEHTDHHPVTGRFSVLD